LGEPDQRAAQLYNAILRRVRAKIAEARAEHAGPQLTVEPMTPPKLRPKILPSPDELIAEMIRDRDAAYARAEEARAEADRLRLDVSAEVRRRAGEALLQ
jgi:hypothetical protein